MEIRPAVFLRWDPRWGYWPRIEIPKEKVKDLRYRVKQMTNRGHTHLAFQEVIDALNPVLLGWGRFYQHCYGAKGVFTRVDHYVWDRLRRWLRKKYPKTPRRQIRRRIGGGWEAVRGSAGWMNARWPSWPTSRWDDTTSQPCGIPTTRCQVLESPVRNERRTPGSGAGAVETTAGNRGIGATAPCSLIPYAKREKKAA